jgi:hypothetical protein
MDEGRVTTFQAETQSAKEVGEADVECWLKGQAVR